MNNGLVAATGFVPLRDPRGVDIARVRRIAYPDYAPRAKLATLARVGAALRRRTAP